MLEKFFFFCCYTSVSTFFYCLLYRKKKDPTVKNTDYLVTETHVSNLKFKDELFDREEKQFIVGKVGPVYSVKTDDLICVYWGRIAEQ